MAGRDLWSQLGDDLDVGLLQEARPRPPGSFPQVLPDAGADWSTLGWPARSFRTAVVPLSDRLQLRDRPVVASHEAIEQVGAEHVPNT